jgi:flagellar biosynthesis/type III secretory pathway protein FliH
MTTAQRIIDKAAPQLRDEGRKEGRKEGLKEGLKEGETRGRAALLQRQLQFKFGDLDPAFVSRIASASADQLDSWAERLLFAASLDELFRQ